MVRRLSFAAARRRLLPASHYNGNRMLGASSRGHKCALRQASWLRDVLSSTDVLEAAAAATRARQEQSSAGFHFYSVRFDGGINASLGEPTRAIPSAASLAPSYAQGREPRALLQCTIM